MRVLILASSSASLRTFRGALIEEIIRNGHLVHACAPRLSADSHTYRWLEARGVICHDVSLSRTGLNPINDFCTFFALLVIFRRIRPDVFFGYTIKPVIWGLLASSILKVPRRFALITGLGYAFTGNASGKRGLVQYIARWLYSTALRSAHLTFFQNNDDKMDFIKYRILSENHPIKIVNGSGVDVDHYALAPFSAKPLTFLLVGRLLGDKGIREYVQAATLLSDVSPLISFHLVGGFDENPNAIDKVEVEEWTRRGQIIWHGEVDDVRPMLASAHVYVLPSYREGTPRSVLEAMAMGRPVITTNAPGCRETVIDGENGFLVPPRSANALAAAMLRFVYDPALIVRMGMRSRELAEEKYDVRKVNAVMISAMGL